MIHYILNHSLRNKLPVMIIYQRGPEIKQRKIQVIKIHEDRILAYCYTHRGIRSFKREGILSAQMIEGGKGQWPYTQPQALDMNHEHYIF